MARRSGELAVADPVARLAAGVRKIVRLEQRMGDLVLLSTSHEIKLLSGGC